MKNNLICNNCGQFSAEYYNGFIICCNGHCADYEKEK